LGAARVSILGGLASSVVEFDQREWWISTSSISGGDVGFDKFNQRGQ